MIRGRTVTAVVVVTMAIALVVSITSPPQPTHSVDNMQQAEQWCATHGGEILIAQTMWGTGTYCQLENGTTVRMQGVGT